MHQTFYIDVDEEISSVIDRLNKSMAKDNYFVVPKRAIFLQSIVNLKLLKREANKVGKHVVIVTQDEIGTSMAERSGLDVRSNLDGLEPVSDIYSESEDESEYDEEYTEKPPAIEKTHKNKQVRLKNIGSHEYYDAAQAQQKQESVSKTAKIAPRRIPINSSKSGYAQKKNIAKATTDNYPRKKTLQARSYQSMQSKPDVYSMDTGKEKNLEKMFSTSLVQSAAGQKKNEGRVKKIFFGFVLLCLLVFAGVAAYLFVPSTKIVIIPNITIDRIDLTVHASDPVQSGDANIPLRVIDEKIDIVSAYQVTGKDTSSSGKKAQGSVVIYNEYSSASQALVATTRLQSDDGKIFRLVKGVTVPGTTVVGGETKPGAIEAEIVADQAGSDYNIDPTNFKIPGFAGGPKFDKFYAKSVAATAGGASGTGGGVAAVTAQDIDNAKAKAQADLSSKATDMINGELKTGEVALSQAQKVAIIKATPMARVGDMADSFNYTISATVRALVFSEDDIRNIVAKSFQDSPQAQDAHAEISKMEYGTANSDFDNATLDLKVYGETTTTPDIDIVKIKNELLGKNEQQLIDILKKYPAIKNVNVEFQPPFISHVSQYAQRVEIKIDTSGK